LSLIRPIQKDQALLDDIAARRDGEHLSIWWLGQSGFLLQWQGRHLLFDPYLSDSLTAKYAATDKPHVRMTEIAVAPEYLDFIDLVTSTHNHTDHLDAETLLPLMEANPQLQLLVPEANRAFTAERLGCDPAWLVGMDDGMGYESAGFAIEGVPAAHEALEKDAEGRHKFMGYVARCGEWTVYHSGDTMRYEGMEERLAGLGIDIALLPINGRAPERRVAGNLFGAEAAQLAKTIGARTVIPCHYEMFEFNTASPEAFANECQRLGQGSRVLRCGECWSSEELV
jgi:L-ascorbate metabolism protein UlaG (beta-lactamase superfamily)